MKSKSRSRLSLLLLAVLLASGALVSSGSISRVGAPKHWPGQFARRALFPEQDIEPAKLAILEHLAALERQPPRAQQWKGVLEHLDDPSWEVTHAAFKVLIRHRHPQLSEALVGLLARAIREETAAHERASDGARIVARREVMRDAVSRLDPASAANHSDLLIQLLFHSADGVVRARALELSDNHPPKGWQRLVLASLSDPSQQVRLQVLDLIASRGWRWAVPELRPLLDSSRPALQKRAGEVAALLGVADFQPPDDRTMLRAAAVLARRLWQAGLRVDDVLPTQTSTERGAIDPELLARVAEGYLDQPYPDSPYTSARGVFLLAAAVRIEHMKLVRRIWEHVVAHSDTDEELLDRGVRAIARRRLIEALSCCRRGSPAEGLGALASLARLARLESDRWWLDSYIRPAERLSNLIWLGLPEAGPRELRPATTHHDHLVQLARDVLGELDLNNAPERAEAYRRLDARCGLAGLFRERHQRLARRVAN